MKVIVTGGAGFIGSAVARYLACESDCEVVVLDKLTYAANVNSLKPAMDRGRCRLIEQDICDAQAVSEILAREQPDYVLHLAAESHVDRSITGSAEFIQTNIVGTYLLLDETRRYWEGLTAQRKETFRFLHVSTDEVYGSLGASGLFTEETAYDPSSPYSASKAASDHLAVAWNRTYGFPVVLSNCSNNYGPYHFPEKLIPLVILNALEHKKLPVYGDGSNVRDWLYVDDHARALWTIATTGVIGQKYNVGGRNERSNLQVVHAICDLVDELAPGDGARRGLIEFVADRPGHDQRYAIDATKLEAELGWKAEHSFETGLRETVGWYLANESWWRPLRSKVYGGERLGLVTTGG